MDFKLNCPNCDYQITEKDFESGTKTFNWLQQQFEKQRQVYLQMLQKKLIDQWKAQEQAKIEAAVNIQTVKLQAISQKNQNQLQAIINEQKIAIENHQALLKTQIAEITNELNQRKNNEFNQLQNIINEKDIILKNQNALIAQKVAETTTQLNEIKNQEVANLKIMLHQKELELNNQQNQLKTAILEHEIKLKEQQQKEIINLHNQINQLKEANNSFKLIQNKTKGENFEHEVEAELRKVFEPNDIIQKITDQNQKADYLQEVRLNQQIIGKIVYEIKNAEWSNSWEKKLITDMSKVKAQYGIIVCTTFNKKFPGIPFKRSDENENLYLCDTESFYFVGQILRTLLQIENNLTSKLSDTDYQEKIQQFQHWKMNELPKIAKTIQDSFAIIKTTEESIIGKVANISKAREKIEKQFLNNLFTYLNTLNFL